jgi:hypothetical protein
VHCDALSQILEALRDDRRGNEEKKPMTVQNPITAHERTASELDQIPQLYAVLAIVEQMAPAKSNVVEIPNEAKLCRAFEKTSGIAKKGFQSVASETVIAATVGARALLGKGSDGSAAAEELSRYLRQRISQLGSFVGL